MGERHNMMNVQLAATLFAFFTPEIQCAYAVALNLVFHSQQLLTFQ